MAFAMPKYEILSQRSSENNPGTLVVEDSFEFRVNKANKEKTVFTYYCKYFRTRSIMCQARAVLVKTKQIWISF